MSNEKKYLLTGKSLVAAQAFHAAVHEYQSDIALLEGEHKRLLATRAQMMRDTTQGIWADIVAPFGLDPIASFSNGSGIDCSNIDLGVAVLYVADQTTAQPADTDEALLERFQPPAGSRLN